uniref:Butyrophilin subfamily 1 member A1-like n=1 Tax=Erpetoichthys calabaricus TaxID=27687 RepID=A0A8C4SUR8_ERPCA
MSAGCAGADRLCYFHFKVLKPSARRDLSNRRMSERATVLGEQPSVFLNYSNEKPNTLECHSGGWHNEPNVTWSNQDGYSLPSLFNIFYKDDSGGFSVKSYLSPKPDSSIYSCLVRPDVSSLQDVKSYLYVLNFSSKADGWTVAFGVLLAIILLAAAAFIVKWKKMNDLERTYEPKAASHLQKEIEWRLIHSSAADVILDQETAHSGLLLLDNGKRMRRGKLKDLPENAERFDFWSCVVGKEGFTSGSHYWVVDVTENRSWRLGAVKGSAKRQGNFTMAPQLGYWVLVWNNDHLKALSVQETNLSRRLKLSSVGIYLDYEGRLLSFYNADVGTHVYTFSNMEFTSGEKVFPLFLTLDMEKDLILWAQ